MKYYSPTGRRNHGRLLKIHLDTWDRNGSTSGPTPWQIYDDDDDICKICHQYSKSSVRIIFISIRTVFYITLFTKSNFLHKSRDTCDTHIAGNNLKYSPCLLVCLFVFLALQPIVVVFSQPGSGL
jgi:hypothetical protein